MFWISNHKHKIKEKSTKSFWSSSKVVGLGPADLWEFPTLIMRMSWHGNAFHLTDPLWGESCNGKWIPQVDSPHKRPIMENFHVFSVVFLNKLLNQLLSCQWFEIPRHSYHITLMLYRDCIVPSRPLDGDHEVACLQVQPPWTPTILAPDWSSLRAELFLAHGCCPSCDYIVRSDCRSDHFWHHVVYSMAFRKVQ